jgi:MFS family permease
VLGPPVAGVLIALLGTSNVLWIDAVTFGISALMVLVVVPDIRHASAEKSVDRPSIVGDALAGLRFVRSDRLILALMVTFALGSLLAEPLYGIVFPVYANEVLGSAVDLGLIYSALAAGSILGNITYGVAGYRLPRRLAFITGWVVRAISFWILVAVPDLWTIALLMALNGFLFEPTNAIFATMMQERVPADLRGRVFGAFSTFASGTMPLGLFAYSLLIEGIGLRSTLVVLAIVNVVSVVSLLWPSTWRELGANKRREFHAEPVVAA